MIFTILGFCFLYIIIIGISFRSLYLNKISILLISYFFIIMAIIFYVFFFNKDIFYFWIIFNYFNFFACCVFWFLGLVEKSFSVNILRNLKKYKDGLEISFIIKNSILPQFKERISLLKRNKDIINSKGLILSKKGISKVKKINKIRKFFKIKNKLLYKL